MKWIVSKSQRGVKLGAFLREKLGLSLRKIKELLESHHCKVNGKIERFASRELHEKDLIIWDSPTKTPESQILYSDQNLLIINKAPGIISSPKNFPDQFLVHRLDKETSGLLILAKNEKVQKDLFALFRNKKIDKEYLTIVKGSVGPTSGVMKSLIKKRKEKTFGSGKTGAYAETHFKVLDKGQKASLLLITPKTGKTHQIRVHLSEMGHPIVGDYHYGQCSFDHSPKRTMLHAYRLKFFYQKMIEIEAPIYQDFEKALQSYRLNHSHYKM